jgi:uncharacterized protein (UPF0332 family)
MNVSDFLDHADELARDGRPAWCRSAISRAYYAAHHAAGDFLFSVGVRVPASANRHVAAFNALIAIASSDQTVSDVGGELMALHTKRNRADYRWTDLSMEGQDQALVLADKAREIVNALSDCLADQDRADLIAQHFQAWVPAHGFPLGLTLV